MYLWRSPYVNLRSHLSELSLEELRAVIDDDPDVDLSGDSFESKAVPEGTQLTVHGELSASGDTTTIEGTSDTPFVVSDGGIGAVRETLRQRTVKYALFLVTVSIPALMVLGSL